MTPGLMISSKRRTSLWTASTPVRARLELSEKNLSKLKGVFKMSAQDGLVNPAKPIPHRDIMDVEYVYNENQE